MERLVARVFYEAAKRTFFANIFFLVVARVNIIIFNLKDQLLYVYILAFAQCPKWQYEITSDRRVRSGVCMCVYVCVKACMRVFSSFTRKWKCLCDATRLFRMRNIRTERGQPLCSPFSTIPSREKSIYFVAVRSTRFSLMKFRLSSTEDLYDGTNHRTVLSYKLRPDV